MIEIYAKKQRAKRKDPQQEAIVAEKDLINERTKKLIALMIAMKKGWNGGPSPDIGVEKFNLTQPIPDVVVGTGDSALRELSEIVQTLRKLKTLQDSYSISNGQRSEALTKMKEQKKQMEEAQPIPPPQTNEVQQQIAAAVSEELMKKTASNPFTRLLTHLTAYNPFASEKNRGYRLELLRSLARVDHSLEDIEDKILSQGESSILDSIYVAKQLYSDAKSSFFGDFRKNINKMVSDAESELKELELAQKNKKPTIVEDNVPPTRTNVRVPTNPEIAAAINNAQEIMAEQPVVVDDKGPALNPGNVVAVPRVTNPETSETNSEKPEVEVNKEEVNKEEVNPVQQAEEKALKREERAKEKAAERAKRLEERAKKKDKKKVPVAPVVVVTPQSDFVDSDFEQIQRERYLKIREYVFKHVDTLLRECLAIANSNLPKFWKVKVREEAQKVRALAFEIAKEIENHEDFDIDYPHFLEGVGIIKSLAYIADTENKAAENNPEFVYGSLFDEAAIKSQAINFAKEQMGIFISMNQKISQASNKASRFIKRMLTHIMPRRDKSLRLTVSRNVRNARKGLQKLLDILEQRNIDFRRLMDASQDFLESVNHVYEGLADLGDMYNSTMRMEKSFRKQNNSKMMYDMIPTMDINSLRVAGKAVGIDLFNIQKLEKLEEDLSGFGNTELPQE